MSKNLRDYIIWSGLAAGLLVLLVFLIIGIVREIGPLPTKTLTPIEQGEQLYATHCATCHGKNREGVVGPPLSSERLEKYSHPELENIILFGRLEKGMPAFENRLSHEQVDSVLELLHPSED